MDMVKRFYCDTCKAMMQFVYRGGGLFSGYCCTKCNGMHNTGQDDDE